MNRIASLSLFIGAGFSKWAVDLPLARQLFDFALEPWGRREESKLRILKMLKESWDRSNPGGEAEQFIAAAMSLSEKEKEIVAWYLTRRLSEPFIWREYQSQRWRRHVLMIDENRRFGIEGVVNAKRFLDLFYGASLNGIVTTNYDMVIEYALGTKRFNYGIPGEVLAGRGPYPVSTWRSPVQLVGRLPLAKIHGSISWDENEHYTDGRRGLTGHALIIAPTPEKRPPDSLRFQWNTAREVLEASTRLIVFGFAFNPYDEAVLDLLRSSGRGVESVLLVDLHPKLIRAQSIWPAAAIASSPPPPAGYPQISDWSETWLR